MNNVCTALPPGSRPGAPCATFEECDGRFGYCNRLNGKCEAYPPLVRAGENCGTRVDGSGETINCVPGTSCVATLGALVRSCLPDLPVGAACHPTVGGRCTRPAACIDATCQIAPPAMCQ